MQQIKTHYCVNNMQRDSIINAYYISVSAFPGKENFIKSHNFCHPIVKKKSHFSCVCHYSEYQYTFRQQYLGRVQRFLLLFSQTVAKIWGGKSSFALESFHFYFTGNSFDVLFSVGFTSSSFASTSFSSQE